MFSHLGRDILKKLEFELGDFGLTMQDAQVWAEDEPKFTKRNLTALDNK